MLTTSGKVKAAFIPRPNATPIYSLKSYPQQKPKPRKRLHESVRKSRQPTHDSIGLRT